MPDEVRMFTVTVPLGGYVGDVVVNGEWFRPQTEREEALATEIRLLNARAEADAALIANMEAE